MLQKFTGNTLEFIKKYLTPSNQALESNPRRASLGIGDMKNFIKVWWHCLLRAMKGHQMCKYTYTDKTTHWECTCGYEYEAKFSWKK